MNYCVPKNREDMCLKLDKNPYECDDRCFFEGLNECVLFPDSICRRENALPPSQRVCPIGYVLCADLTCRENYEKCEVNDNKINPPCRTGRYRCADQTCVNRMEDCPSTITCSKEDQVVCPDGTCVDNEIYCNAFPSCRKSSPFRCANNLCVSKIEDCPKNTACGEDSMFCSNLKCREVCW